MRRLQKEEPLSASLMTSNPRPSYMDLALAEAHKAAQAGEVPVGAVIIDESGRIVSQAHNATRRLNDPSAHAEMLAIRAACASLGQERLTGFDLYVTLEPCPMCAGAISNARIRRLYYAAADPKSGGVDHGPRVFTHTTCHHAPDVYAGLSEEPARALLQTFFGQRR